jgi:hypothetical protein
LYQALREVKGLLCQALPGKIRARPPVFHFFAEALGTCNRRSPLWLFWMERYGKIIRMKKTLHIDENLLQEARSVSHAATDTETVRLGLEALIRHAAHERLRALRGTDPSARDVPRRRERPVRRRRGA